MSRRALARTAPAALLAAASLVGAVGARVTSAADEYEVVEVKGGGTIRGICRIKEVVEPWKVKVTKDQDKGCGEDHVTERMVVGEDRALANCVVTLAISKGKDWSEEMKSDDRTALVDQKGCRFVPHVSWVRTETQIVVGNSDQADHNTHAYRDTLAQTQFNFISAPGTKQEAGDAFLEKAGKYLLKCDIHPWMSAYVHVVSNPYVDVTSEKGSDGKKPGEYVLKDVPPGTYEVSCWHEGMKETPTISQGLISSYSYDDDVVKKGSVTVEAGKEATLDFEFDPPPK
jgi:plastocyanin